VTVLLLSRRAIATHDEFNDALYIVFFIAKAVGLALYPLVKTLEILARGAKCLPPPPSPGGAGQWVHVPSSDPATAVTDSSTAGDTDSLPSLCDTDSLPSLCNRDTSAV
jgi:hypothetical protein